MQKISKVSLVAVLSLVGGCGGSDGSSTPSAGAGPLQGNLSFQISGCTAYSGGIGAELSASASADVKRSQLPATDGTQPGRLLEDGEEGASVECSIDGGMPHDIQARISGVQSHPGAQFVEDIGLVISDGWINSAESGGTGEAVITIQTGGVAYRTPADSVCSLSLESTAAGNQFSVAAGRIYARFDCPGLEDPPMTGCVASGAFVFEGCAEGD